MLKTLILAATASVTLTTNAAKIKSDIKELSTKNFFGINEHGGNIDAGDQCDLDLAKLKAKNAELKKVIDD